MSLNGVPLYYINSDYPIDHNRRQGYQEITNIENVQLSYGKPKFEQQGIIIASSDKLIHKEICLQIKVNSK
mgnify:CR=1 FL=1